MLTSRSANPSRAREKAVPTKAATVGAAYYLRIAAACYIREPTAEFKPEGGRLLRFAVAVCTIAMIVLFIAPNAVVRQAQLATDTLNQVQRTTVAQKPVKQTPQFD